jgi:DNA polymerase I-like protein with 3'-5' exonuclease and polymerase domains
MKDGLLRLWEKDLLQYVVAIVHDEVVLDVPRDEAAEIADTVRSVLEDHTFWIPLTAEASVYGESWGDGYTDK